MSLRLRPSERIRSWRGWLIPTALLALAPKCTLCLLAYAGLGTLLGIGGKELCGEANSAPGYWLIGMICVVVVPVVGHFLRRSRYRV